MSANISQTVQDYLKKKKGMNASIKDESAFEGGNFPYGGLDISANSSQQPDMEEQLASLASDQGSPTTDDFDAKIAESPGDEASLTTDLSDYGVNPPNQEQYGPPSSLASSQGEEYGPPESMASPQNDPLFGKLSDQLASSYPNLSGALGNGGGGNDLGSSQMPASSSDRMPAQMGSGGNPSFLIPNLLKAFSNVNRGAMTPKDNGLADDMNNQIKYLQGLKQNDLNRQAKVQQFILAQKLGLERAQQILDAQTKAKMGLMNQQNQNAQDLAKLKASLSPQNNQQQLNAIKGANSLLKDSPIQLEVKKLNAARGGQALLDEIANNKLTPTQNVVRMLNTLVTTTEMGGPGAVEDRKHAGVNNIYMAAKNAQNYWTENPQGILPKPLFNQLKTELTSLGARAAQNYSNMVKGKEAMAQESPGVSKNIHNSAETFLKNSGFDYNGNPLEQEGAGKTVKIKSPSGKVYEIDSARQDVIKRALSEGGSLLQQ